MAKVADHNCDLGIGGTVTPSKLQL